MTGRIRHRYDRKLRTSYGDVLTLYDDTVRKISALRERERQEREMFGFCLRNAREREGLSIHGLSGKTGVSLNTIWDIEKGEFPDRETAESIAKELDKT